MKIKQFIATYNNEFQINKCLDSIFNSLNKYELSILEIFIINNHSNLNIHKEYLGKVKILNNELRPDFSTGHLSRTWNQSIINGFKDLKNPDCDILITNHDDTKFVDNYIEKLINYHKTYDFITFGRGDNFISYTVNAVKKIGLWDERFCNIGHHEQDYFLRANKFLKDKSINDSDFMIVNPIDSLLLYYPAGFERKEEYSIK